MLNNASMLYLSALAAAVGFRMGLFNIGVEGQYRIGVFFAAAFAGQAWLPGPLNVVVAILVAMLAGAAWAAIAGLLKVTRGVSEVISTIMLNAIAVSLTAYLLRQWGIRPENGGEIRTVPIEEGSRVPGFDIPFLPGAPNEVFGLAVLAVIAGIAFGVVINRTRFGFELRATGASPTAAVASGIDVRRKVVVAMLLSGGIAGLVGLPLLLGSTYTYTTTFQAGLGFTGIAVALLGRNNPWGIAVGALLFAYLSEQATRLELLVGISSELVVVTQGVVVLAVVIAYEVAGRYRRAQEQREVAEKLAQEPGTADPQGVTR
jgi:general nucleoside transport system permease protein